MTNTNKALLGLALFTPSVALFAQTPSAPKPASAPASQVEPNIVVNPTDPTWMVADVGIALVAGLVIGYLIGAWRSSAKNRASHA